MPESESRFKHVLDHIIARQHGGKADLPNLALCCGQCNLFKGPNIAGIDPVTGGITRLFNPRNDRWAEHFRYESGVLVGLTAVGRAMANVLSINLPIRIAARKSLADIGISFP